jgi:hypothetical protein
MLLVSMVGAMILGGLPWWMGRRVPASVLSGLNGQCWMIDADTYRRLDPHRNNRGEILEDILIGRYLHRMGTTPLLVDFQRELAVYMYDDLKEAWRGFRRSAAEALGKSFPGAMAGLLAYLFFFVAVPMVHPGFLIPLYALKATTDRASRIPYRNTLVAPISFLLAGALTADSIVKRTRRRLEWKGRILSTGR